MSIQTQKIGVDTADNEPSKVCLYLSLAVFICLDFIFTWSLLKMRAEKALVWQDGTIGHRPGQLAELDQS